jgi:hypothetical protein
MEQTTVAAPGVDDQANVIALAPGERRNVVADGMH